MSEYLKIKLRFRKNELIKDSFWALLGNVFGKGLSFVAGIYIARFLGKDIFGEYGILRNTVVSISILSTFGLGYTVTKFIADSNDSNNNRIFEIIKRANQITWVSGGILTVAVVIFSDEIAIIGFNAPHLSLPLRIVALWILFNALTTTQIGVLSGLGKFKTMAQWNAFIGFITFVSSVTLTYYFGLIGALWGLLFSQIINWVIFSYIIKVQLKRLFLACGDLKKSNFKFSELIKFSIPVAMQEISYSVLGWLTSVLFIRVSNFSEFGVYSAGLQVSVLILFIPAILRNVFLSHLSSNVHDYVKYRKVLKSTVIINLISTSIPVIVVLMFLGPIQHLYGPTFPKLSGVIVLLSINTIPLSIINVLTQSFMSRGKNWLLFWIKLIKDVFAILLFFIFYKFLNVPSEALAVSMLLINTMFLFVLIIWDRNLSLGSSFSRI